MLLRLFTAHTPPYTKSVLGQQAFFGFLNPEDGADRLSDMSVRNYHCSLRNNPDERSSQLLHSGCPKS